TFTVYDILEKIQPGFCDWLEDPMGYSFAFDAAQLPETLDDLYEAFGFFYSKPKASLEFSNNASMEMLVNVNVADPGKYTYGWFYMNPEGEWVKLTDETGAPLNASNCDKLQDGGANVICKLYENGKIAAVTDSVFVNPVQFKYDKAIEEINEGLHLSTSKVYTRSGDSAPAENIRDLSIGGTRFNDYFFYGNVSKDLPVTNSTEYKNYLAKEYINAGGGENGLAVVKAIWDRYLYDMYDPSFDAGKLSNITAGTYPFYTYGDKAITWPKDTASSFNTAGSLTASLKNLNYD
ncbi:MAG: hypothetical protein Q4D12_11505, partial [Bacteroidales bacterium]|nr:hypothetical protein [Bacteroidales bacterium]